MLAPRVINCIWRISVTLLFALHAGAVNAQEREEARHLIDRVADQFVGLASTAWQEYSICEYRSKNTDRSAWLRKSFGSKLAIEGVSVEWKELAVSEVGTPSSRLPVGFMALIYPDEKRAGAAYAQLTTTDKPYLQGWLVLTRYKAITRGKIVLLIYSEAFRRKIVGRFLDDVVIPSQ